MTTKEKIIQVSLELFAKKGYDGVSVREIAKAVGVRESALYKHYKNKEDILEKVIEAVKESISKTYMEYQVPEAVSNDVTAGYQKLMDKELLDMAWKLFELYTKDPMVSDFRRLLMREQFEHPDIAMQYNRFFLDGAVKSQAKTFEKLIWDHYFKDADPTVAALHFYGPILLLFQRYDCNPDGIDEIKELLFAHVKAFGENYAHS
ncbi:MAG: TetR/AcrR family transcriptional regulator [Clostridia bacterium]|nr:TetR/AcrR family transcriptional regulator [Clostridia bacterium]